MNKVYAVNLYFDGVTMYGRLNKEEPMKLYKSFEKAVSEAAADVVDVLQDEMGVAATVSDLQWTKTRFGGEWTFYCKYLTGYAHVICTITEERVR